MKTHFCFGGDDEFETTFLQIGTIHGIEAPVRGRALGAQGHSSGSFEPPLDPSAPAVRKRPHGRDSIEGTHASVSLYAPEWNSPGSTALAWTEAITLITQGHAPDEVFDEARTQFTHEELVNLTMAIVAINGWNRLAIGFREVPGTYLHGRKKRPSGRLTTDRPDGIVLS